MNKKDRNGWVLAIDLLTDTRNMFPNWMMLMY